MKLWSSALEAYSEASSFNFDFSYNSSKFFYFISFLSIFKISASDLSMDANYQSYVVVIWIHNLDDLGDLDLMKSRWCHMLSPPISYTELAFPFPSLDDG